MMIDRYPNVYSILVYDYND